MQHRVIRTLVILGLAGVCLATAPALAKAPHGPNGPHGSGGDDAGEPAPHSVARLWNEVLLDAIRREIPKPTAHSRNLFHMSAAMWDAWAAYEPLARGYFVDETATAATADDVEAAREEAISYAAYRILQHRYRYGPGEEASQAEFDALMDELGYDRDFTDTSGDSPAALGNRIAQTIVEFGLSDGANEGYFLDYADDTGYAPVNAPMVIDLPGTTMNDPNHWQPLAFDYLVLQNGIVIGQAVQTFINPNWGKVEAFCLKPEQQAFPWVYLDPGPPPGIGGPGDEQFRDNAVTLIRLSSYVDPDDPTMMDISPGAIHNNTLGTHDGTGRPVNPYTGEPYEPNLVRRADYGRVIAEFWADGPHSETPPGHWNTLANYVTDHPLFERRIHGEGPELPPLEWDVKLYLALNGAVHDAAVTAWGIKGYYDYSRPISHIRYMAELGQSTDPGLASYDPLGLPLIPGLIELITPESSAPGERHEHLASRVGEIAIRAWRGNPNDPETEVGGVGWIRAKSWVPYQRDTFVTPAFAGYISGHSTFSRAAAEVLTGITGSEFFPGGYGTFVAEKDVYLEFESGPSETVELQWATYYDASDEAGISRQWGGIHPAADDFPARIIGSVIGKQAWEEAQKYYDSDRATLCHVPRRNPARAHTIVVSAAAAPAHLAHGDNVGSCEEPSDEPAAAAVPDGRRAVLDQVAIAVAGKGAERRAARAGLVEGLAQPHDPATKLAMVRALTRDADPALVGLLDGHLREIRRAALEAGDAQTAAAAEHERRRLQQAP
jgi:hypothetical protein